MNAEIGLLCYGALFACFAAGAWLRPPVAIAAMICLYGLKQLGQASNAWLAAHGVFTNFAIAAVVSLAIARRQLQGRLTPRGLPSVYWLTLAFYAYALLSTAWTPSPEGALRMWGNDYAYMLMFVLAAPWLAASTAELRNAFGWMICAGGLLVLALLFATRWGDRGLIVHLGGILDETNPLAIADLAGPVAIAALFFVPSRFRAVAWPLRLIIAAVGAIAIVRSGSRGQLVALCFSILAMLPVAYPIGRVRGALGGLAAVAVIGAAIAWGISSYVHAYDDRWLGSTEAGDVAGRLKMVSSLLKAWGHDAMSVLFGIGNSGSFAPWIAGFYPHNVPMEILGEEGLIGFAMYLALLLMVSSTLLRGVRRAGRDLPQRGLLAVSAGCLLFTWIVSLKEGNAVGSVTFFMLAVLCCRVAQQVPPQRRSPAREPARLSSPLRSGSAA